MAEIYHRVRTPYRLDASDQGITLVFALLY